MHELSLTQSIVGAVVERAQGQRVHAVFLKVGLLSGVSVEALRFCFDLCAEGTVVAGARLEIEEIPGRAHCDTCAREIAIDLPIALCPCETRSTTTIVAGQEFTVRAIELDCDESPSG